MSAESELSMKATAERLGVSKSTVKAWVADGLPSRLVMHGLQERRVIDQVELDEWLAAQRAERGLE